LVGHGVDVNAQNHTCWTLLHRATFEGKLEVARTLLKHGTDVEAEDDKGMTAFQLASEVGHVKIMSLLSGHHAKHEGKS
jgi:ankyrin repeat protein